MRALWADPHVVFEGEQHTIPNAGINPLPTSPLEVWIGGGVDATCDRIGRMGDGWLNIYVGPDKIGPALERIRTSAEQAGRDPAQIGLECWVGMGGGTPDDWRAEIEMWRSWGATHITVNTVFNRGHIKPIEGRDVKTHLQAIEEYMAAVGDLF